MYLVTCEQDDGAWFDDPEAFDTLTEARDYAAVEADKTTKNGNPGKVFYGVYECRLLEAVVGSIPTIPIMEEE